MVGTDLGAKCLIVLLTSVYGGSCMNFHTASGLWLLINTGLWAEFQPCKDNCFRNDLTTRDHL